MELGFSISAGPLSQISVPVVSIELAVQLATGAYGWWKARDRGRSMLGLVESKQCQLSTTSSFNLLRYVDRRKGGLIRGVARNPDGILSCVTLPNASTASSGDQGLACLRAVVCALLCFYNSSTVVEILIDALPGTLYTSNQDGGDEAIEGAMVSSLRQYVKAAASEENSDDLRQKLLDAVDSKLGNVTGATSKDVFECDNLLESDVANFIGVLKWILTPSFNRNQHVYPTRSLKVWALSLIMSQLGFEVTASMHAVSSESDYRTYVQDFGYQPTYQEVILVTSSVGPTDPLTARGGGYRLSSLDSNPRTGSIRSIPWIAFRNLQDNPGLATPKYLSEVWEFTFEYVSELLEPPKPWVGTRDLFVVLEFTGAALESFGKDLHPKLAHIDQRSKFWDDFQWLTFVIYHPLMKFATPQGKLSLWNERDILSQFKGATPEYAALPDGEILDDWYITRAVVLATIYAVCCKWLYIDDESQSLLDTEIAFSPDYIRRGNLGPWTSFEPFSTVLLPEHRPARGFWSEMEHKNWFTMLVNVFSGVPNDPALKVRAERGSSSRDRSFKSILGFQKNGVVFLPNLLVSPSANSKNWFRYHIRVGQVLDVPLQEDGFICASSGPAKSLQPASWTPDPSYERTLVENPLPDTVARIDPEPWWEFDERTVVFRARVGGSVKAVFSPAALFLSSHSLLISGCECSIPKALIRLDQAVYVLRLSEFILHAPNMLLFNGEPPRSIVVQTGGDPIAQVLCLALASTRIDSLYAVIGCIEVLQQNEQRCPSLILL